MTGWADVLERGQRSGPCPPGVSRACQRFPCRGAGDTWPQAEPQADPRWPLCRPHGKSYLYFTQFRAEVRGAEIEYGMAYVSTARMGVRSQGDRQDEDRDTERLEGEFVIRKNTGTAQTPRPGGAGGGGCAHRGPCWPGRKRTPWCPRSTYCLPATCWESQH